MAVGASIDYSSFTAMIRRLDTVPKHLQKDLVKTYHDAGPAIVADMKGAAFTKIQNRAASTVTFTRESDGIALHGGGHGGLSGELFAGGEFGGRKSKKVTYATRSPNGKAYTVRRRTTMQFLPHLGTTGYFFWPTVREWGDRLLAKQKIVLAKSIGGGR